jgi:hypothetical protein
LIIGIVIALLLVAVIVLLVVFIVLRRKQHRDVVPRRIRDTMIDIRNRLSIWTPPPAYSERAERGEVKGNDYAFDDLKATPGEVWYKAIPTCEPNQQPPSISDALQCVLCGWKPDQSGLHR